MDILSFVQINLWKSDFMFYNFTRNLEILYNIVKTNLNGVIYLYYVSIIHVFHWTLDKLIGLLQMKPYQMIIQNSLLQENTVQGF